MTPARRIALNVAATYGRSLLVLGCGLFTARWLLAALGASDYGLWSVIGGMAAFVSFLNTVLAQSGARFLAVAIGEGRGLAAWFRTSVVLHVALATVLAAVGWPVGEAAVAHVLAIPPGRLPACLFVWRCVCLWTWFAMAAVPWTSLYVARQEIAEMTAITVCGTVANTLFVAWMAAHPGDWLSRYAAWTVAVLCLPQLALVLRARRRFPELRAGSGTPASETPLARVRALAAFAGWRTLGLASGLLTGQGVALAVNCWLGAVPNAALAVGNAAGSQSQALGAAMSGALTPAVSTAVGARDLPAARALSHAASRLGAAFVLVFSVPLALEIGAVMRLWLGDPPPGAAGLCVCVLAAGVLEKLVSGHWLMIQALGRIRGYQVACLGCGIAAFALAVGGVASGGGLAWAGAAIVLDKAGLLAVRLVFGRRLAALAVGEWCRRVAAPCLAAGLAALAAGGLFIRLSGMTPGISRVVLTTLVCEAVFLPCAWRFALGAEERRAALRRFGR